MELQTLLVGSVAFVCGGASVYAWARQANSLARLSAQREAEAAAAEKLQSMAAQVAAAQERQAAFEMAQSRMEESFRSLSVQALRENNRSFLDLAEQKMARASEASKSELERRQAAIDALVKPLQQALASVDGKIGELEKSRVGAYEALRTMVASVEDSQRSLRLETGNLVRALRAPEVRGRWGEIQLRRVVELAGMVDHCDFVEQDSVATDSGRLRPDMRVLLPGGNSVVVDSKVPLVAYLEAVQTESEAGRKEHLQRHAAQVRTHIEQLSKKAYWEQFDAVPEFVVLFLPGEVFFSAALEQDPELIAFGAERRVVVASPTTLIALLRAVHHGWRQEALARNAQEISALGRELHKRIGDFAQHLAKLGGSLSSAVDHFNKATGSLESRVLVTARKFEELKAANPEAALPELSAVDRVPVQLRSIQSPSASDGTAA